MTEPGNHNVPVNGPINLLLVEDNSSHALLLRDLLEAAYAGQYLVEVAPTLKAAQTVLTKHASTAVLLDLSLPDSQGIETIERLWKAAPSVPIVVLIDLDDKDVAAQRCSCGGV